MKFYIISKKKSEKIKIIKKKTDPETSNVFLRVKMSFLVPKTIITTIVVSLVDLLARFAWPLECLNWCFLSNVITV
jgi:hypothetical protein